MTRCHPTLRRGALLFEVMLSVTIFVTAGAFALAATRSVADALDRAGRRQVAIDLARSKMAELEAGLISLNELREEWSGAIGSRFRSTDVMEAIGRPPGWTFDVETSRSVFLDLTLVELTVSETADTAAPPAAAHVASFTLRQLVRLRPEEAEQYEVDPLLEGLPEAGGAGRAGP